MSNRHPGNTKGVIRGPERRMWPMDQSIHSPQLQTIIAHLRGIAQEALATAGDLESKRRLVDKYFAAHPSVLEHAASTVPVTLSQCTGLWITTQRSDPARRLLYLHGGSWMAGRASVYLPHIARVANATGCTVLAVDYRLAPENPFPAGLEDCVEAFLWMLEQGLAHTGRAQSYFIAGDSAGGNLTLATLLALKDRSAQMPDAAIALSPATDLTWSGESMTTRALVDPALNAVLMPLVTNIYLQGRAAADAPLVSPLFGYLRGLPPLLLQVGDAEILLSDSMRFAERARAAGVAVTLEVYPYMPHVFQGFAPYLPEAVDALRRVGEFSSVGIVDGS